VVRKKLLVYRKWCGLGDWIMALTVLKMLNQQFPDIDIYVNLKGKSNFAAKYVSQRLPDLVIDIIENFDVKIKGYTFYDKPEEHRKSYDYISGHMHYTRDGTPFIEDMTNNLAHMTGLRLEYKDTVFAHHGKSFVPKNPSPYVLIQSCSKRREKGRKGKDYGFNNMTVISRILSTQFNVIQIGQETDWFLPNVARALSLNLTTLHELMMNCLCFVGMDGGLGVYASHHKIKQYIIYEEAERFGWTNFPNRTQLDGSVLKPEEIGEQICEELAYTK